MKTIQKVVTQPTHWNAFYLLLLLVVVVSLLIGLGLRVVHLFGPSLGTSDTIPKLDSFSEPSIAAAILRQYAQDLFSNSNLGRDPDTRAQTSLATMAADRAGAAIPEADKGWLPLHAAGNVEGAQVSSLERLERLQQEIKKLNTDLTYKQMYVHFANRKWNQFLDCYLQLLQAAPDRPDGRYWAHWALAYSVNCGRADEVVDALQHVARFHPDLKTSTGLKAVLEEWAKDPAGLDDLNR